ncbi:MAG: hypothetical protein ACR2OC_03860 [Solirubrobacterales bacterium]
MRKLQMLRARMSYANVAATLALFLALGGGAAIAAGQITAKDLAPDSVGGSELKADAAKGKHIKEDTLEAVPTAGKANNVLWAVVSNTAANANATVVRSGQDLTTAFEGGGIVEVDFGRPVASCVWNVTRGSAGANSEQAGYAQAQPGSTANRVQVQTRNANGEIVDGDFHLTVIC